MKFKNLNFKLAIIQELMYVQEILKPKFDVYDFCKEYIRKEIIPDDYFDEIDERPVVRQEAELAL